MDSRTGWLCLFTACLLGGGCSKPSTPAVAGKEEPAIPAQTDAVSSVAAQIEAGGLNDAGEIVLSAPADRIARSTASVEQAARSVTAETASASAAVGDDQAATSKRPLELASSKTSSNDLEAKSRAVLPAGANVALESELNQTIAEDWPQPQVVLYVSGQQHGYLEPCGCTGLDRQKGGLIRRDTLLTSLRDRGWEVIPVDVGNQVRRIGRQAELKFKTTSDAFRLMKYAAATLGVDDLKLSSVELLQVAASDGTNDSPFITANVSVLDPSFFPASRIVEAGGRKIGITAFLGEEYRTELTSDDIEFFDPVEKLKPTLAELQQAGCDFIVLLAHASIKESAAVAGQLQGVDLVVTAGGFGEPTLAPEAIEGSSAVMVQVGVKGMHGGIVGLFDDPGNPIRYQRLAISAQFKDSPRMLEEFAEYQSRLKEIGFDRLGATPISHPTGRKFVGSESCGDCHSTAFDIWRNSPHYHATESVVHPPNDRGGIERHFDPECVSCHVTGWEPQKFQPFDSGYMSLEKSDLLLGSGCENCHGPGSEHVAAENGDIDVDNATLERLRQEMVLPLDRAREKCLECHDLDNSPDFHAQPIEETFSKYWERVKHYGKD
jgi:hypothetical protein